MRSTGKKWFASFAAIMLAMLMAVSVSAAEMEETTPVQEYEINSAEDLLAMAKDPNGSYTLMTDLDMTDYPWTAVDFNGVFNGNGHAILNLTIVDSSDMTMPTYDGNRIAYDTYGAGLFGCISGAEIRDVQLINVRSVYETDAPCFLGAVAGVAQDSLISGCKISGELELRAYDRMFGVAGIVGYGYGTIENCEADVTLICVDTDATTKDEQFLGGAYSAGFFSVLDSVIKIDGYDSEHGYVHNGGITGLYMQHPKGIYWEGHISGNTVEGKISFYEDNNNRRAYCSAIIGEVLNYTIQEPANQTDFVRDESYDYSVELRPHMCEEPQYSVRTVVGECIEYGYDEYTCDACGYTYTDHYTLPQHTITQWSTVKPATEEMTGLSKGACDLCGYEEDRVEETIEPTEPETTAEETAETIETPEADPVPENRNGLYFLISALVAVFSLFLIIAMVHDFKRKKK